MENDNEVLKHIERLSEEEEHLYAKGGDLTGEEIKKLHKMKVELDQCWDLLNQRRALREASKNPDNAKMRPPGIVENFEQ